MMNTSYFRIAQLVLTGLTLVFAIAVLGTSAHTLSVFNKQHEFNPWWAPLWSDHFDVNGTKMLLGSAVVVMLLNAVYLVISFLPNFNLATRPTFRAFITLCTVLPSAFLTISAVALAHVLNHNSPDVDTIQTWTCKFGARDDSVSVKAPSDISNAAFPKLCTESKFALYTTLVIFLLQGITVALTVVGWIAEQLAKRKQTKDAEWQDASSVEMAAPQFPRTSGPIPQPPPY
ncbi:hypothetical protein EJ05DRAFT_487153 [Pseudovirgaria hyperparasitica]|uniref:MARVEL domain-containing protein n=1 Tax=Pseudovirgaria hyperparasitica TaxID=470096 RepID=A0A6A6W5F6_9PEZI|nr:uncharacterized protein EJ05DRAFT_487153 [Pseudovirgaria hyperparasitica]KAF2757186.1 hypothetical protein EJ05DRAFT_487153 [Pseudovirgaria hyperparasitica]